LSVEWRSRAEKLSAWGAADAARLWTLVADELDRWTEQHELEALPLGVASDESGYSTSWLSKMISDGKIPNAGRQHAPLIRRGDLPRKIKAVENHRRPDGAPDLAGPVLARQGLVVPEDS
jgi:hypothetical protein